MHIRPSKLHGNLLIPTSKSHTIRSLLFALMAKGKSRIQFPLSSPDTDAMIAAICQFGAQVKWEGQELLVQGVAGKPLSPKTIDCGNSGQVLRFLGALSALCPSQTSFIGDASIRQNRPVAPLISALQQLGANASNESAPLIVQGPLQGHFATLDGADSQPVSGLLMLGAFYPLELLVTNPGEKPWVNLTLHWLDRFGVRYENHNFERYKTAGNAEIQGFTYRVPGDFSSAAFPLAAALVTNSEVTLEGIDQKDIQGDKAIIPLLESMGAKFETESSRLTVKKGSQLKGRIIDVNDFIDALPILAVIGCFATGETHLINGTIARKKESDRIACIVKELKKMGADIEEKEDGLIVRHSSLQGANNLQSHNDHRLALALCVAALGARGESTLHGVECTAKSYPNFFNDFKSIGAQLT